MPYLGKQITTLNFPVDYFTGDNTTVAFNLQIAPASTSSIHVTIDGVSQSPVAYTLNGIQLTFTEAPPTTVANNVVVRHLGTPVGVGAPADGTVTAAKIATDAVTRPKLINGAVSNLVVRQTALAGSVDANGQANFLSAGTGLNVNLAAAATPVRLAIANGFDDHGSIDYIGSLTTDTSSYFANLPANNISYLFVDRHSVTGALTPYKTLVPPQYGTYFDKTKQALLHFEGADASTSMIDDYGNIWTAVGNAQIDTAQFKIGTSSLLLDGAGDYIENTSITSLGSGSWTISCYSWRVNTVNSEAIIAFGTSGNNNVYVLWNNAANSITLQLSSNNSTPDINNSATGSSYGVGAWHHIELTYDSVAGKYFLYVNGVAAITVTSALKVAQCGLNRIGLSVGSVNPINGWIDEFELVPYCKHPNGTTFTPPTLPFTTDAEWFDTSEFKYKQGSPTAWTEKQRICVGEATTGAATISSAVTYALRGQYISPETTIPTVSTKTTVNHNIGISPTNVMFSPRCKTAEAGYVPGDEITHGGIGGNASYAYKWATVKNRTAISFTTGSITSFGSANLTTGTDSILSVGSWKLIITADRGW